MFQRKIPLNDKDSTPYDVLFVARSLQSYSFLRQYATHFFTNEYTIDGFILFNDLYILFNNFCKFLAWILKLLQYFLDYAATTEHNLFKRVLGNQKRPDNQITLLEIMHKKNG